MAYSFYLYYSANGGSGAPSTQSGSSTVKQYTFTVSSSSPSRTGYNFRGWSSSSSGSASYSAGDSIIVTLASGATSASRTLYAVWSRRTYTVSYSANGGSGAPSSQSKSYNVDLTLSSTTPTRSGYTFEGWAASSDGGVVYSPGGTYTANASVTLYAVWTENAPTYYTVYYSANGGSGAPSSQSFEAGYSVVLSSVVPTRTDYTFLGWARTATATTAAYQPGDVYSGSSVTLYAVWTYALANYPVTYNAAGGSGAPASQTKIETHDLTLSLITPTRYPYRFVAWNTALNGSGTSYSPGAVYSADAALTLYAQWELIASSNYGGATNTVQGGQEL